MKPLFTAKDYKHPITGQVFQNCTISVSKVENTEKNKIREFTLKSENGILNDTNIQFWNDNEDSFISVKRKVKVAKDAPKGTLDFKTELLKNLSEVLPTDEIQHYGKMSQQTMVNCSEINGQEGLNWRPTTELGWKQLHNAIVYFQEPIAKQFSYEFSVS